MGTMRRKTLDAEQIIDIARRSGCFAFRASPYDQKPDRVHRSICKQLESKGVLAFAGKAKGQISYSFIAYPGCPKAAEKARLRKRGDIGPRFSTERVIAILERRGRLVAKSKPKTGRERSFAAQCQKLQEKGELVIQQKGDGQIVYVKPEAAL